MWYGPRSIYGSELLVSTDERCILMGTEFDAGDEETVREFIKLVDEARFVSLGDAPRWGDTSALVEVTGDA